MVMGWDLIFDFGLLSVLLLFATVLRAKSKFVQKLLIPNALLAGSIGLLIRFLFNRYLGVTLIDTEMGTSYVYHLLNISFAAIALTAPIPFKALIRAKIKGATSTGLYMIFMFCLQSFIGFGIALLLINTFFPDLFPNFGFMMAWGFTLGPGQAASIGKGLELAAGFENGEAVGLIFGALGFVWACLIGVPIIHWGIRKGLTSYVKDPEEIKGLSGIVKERKPSAGRLTTSSEALDSFTLQLALCGLIYLLAYAQVKGVVMFAEARGIEGVDMIWGFVFFIVALIGIMVRSAIDRLKVGHIVDPGLQTRISGTCIDLMVTCAIVIIPLAVVKEYAIPLLLISSIGGIVTLLVTMWLAKRIWTDHQFERMILCYGTLTGTIGTGLALLRVVDPHFRSPAAIHYALGMWLAMAFMAPIIIIENLAIGGRHYLTLLAFLVYTCILFSLWRLLGLWTPKRPYSSIWPKDDPKDD